MDPVLIFSVLPPPRRCSTGAAFFSRLMITAKLLTADEEVELGRRAHGGDMAAPMSWWSGIARSQATLRVRTAAGAGAATMICSRRHFSVWFKGRMPGTLTSTPGDGSSPWLVITCGWRSSLISTADRSSGFLTARDRMSSRNDR